MVHSALGTTVEAAVPIAFGTLQPCLPRTREGILYILTIWFQQRFILLGYPPFYVDVI